MGQSWHGLSRLCFLHQTSGYLLWAQGERGWGKWQAAYLGPQPALHQMSLRASVGGAASGVLWLPQDMGGGVVTSHPHP